MIYMKRIFRVNVQKQQLTNTKSKNVFQRSTIYTVFNKRQVFLCQALKFSPSMPSPNRIHMEIAKDLLHVSTVKKKLQRWASNKRFLLIINLI